MNDCLIGWFKECDCKCTDCKKYISVNEEKGNALLEQYQKEIDEAIEPIKLKWIEKLESEEE